MRQTERVGRQVQGGGRIAMVAVQQDERALFRRHPHLAVPVDGRLLHRLSPDGSLCLEVTFPVGEGADEGDLYVNLVDRSRDYMLHLSIRPATGRIVLNDRTGGTWGRETGAAVDFSALRSWRIWLMVQPDGAMEASLGGIVLCRRASETTPDAIGIIESNVTAHPALPVVQHGAVTALADATGPQSAAILLFIADEASLGPKALRTTVGPLSDIRRLTIAGRRCWHCTARFEEGAARLLHHKDSAWPVHDVRTMPVLELAPPRLTLRAGSPLAQGPAHWQSADTGRRLPTHLFPAQGEGQPPHSGGTTRYTTRLSELLDFVSGEGEAAELSLQAPDLPEAQCRLSIRLDALSSAQAGALTHPCVVQSLAMQADLRRTRSSLQAQPGVPFVPGVLFRWDPADAGACVVREAEDGALLTADITMAPGAGQICLEFDLGPGSFVPGDVIGLVLYAGARGAARGSQPGRLVPHVRSAGAGGTQDTVLAESFALGPEPGVALVLHRVGPGDALTWLQDAHVLVLPLPRQTHTLSLVDLRFLFVPAPDRAAAQG